jgi:subtilisin family serine protease
MSTSKLDPGLAKKYAEHLRARRRDAARDHTESIMAADAEAPAAANGVRVAMQYEGDLASIEAAGFQTVANPDPGHATGIIRFDDLGAVAAHPGVLKLTFGREPRPRLDVSVPDVRANQVWTRSGDNFTNAGQGVVVGIIDTGIDYRHPFFRDRIVAVWDLGLVPQGSEHSPNANLLSGDAGAGKTYGVEYGPADFTAETARHRDCSGHGTHVASIAAGDGRGDYKFIGVAPRAEIIAVKLVGLENDPTVDGNVVEWSTRFHDAVSYILNKAAPKPVVINCSFGNDLGPHDGFSDDEDWVTHRFRNESGKLLVGAAGNAASIDDPHKRAHAQLDFPAGGETELYIELYDERTSKIDYKRCRAEEKTEELWIVMYYPSTAANVTVGFAVPSAPATYHAQAHGTSTDHDPAAGRHWQMRHDNDPQILRGGRGTIQRKLISIAIHPYGPQRLHDTRRYRVKLKSPSATTMHVWVEQARGYGLRIESSPAYPNWVKREDRHLIGDQGGANMITVAAYDAEAGDAVTGFSSRGPLVTWGPLPAGVTQPPKPDLSAPGKKIDAAMSQHTMPSVGKAKKNRTVAKKGTSMSAPHVAGAVALMLQKNAALTVQQIITKLRTPGQGVRALGGGESVDDYGQGRLDVKGAVESA